MSAAGIADVEIDASLSRLHDALRTHGPTLNLLFEYARASTDEESCVREAFAGAVAQVLHDVLRQYWKERGGTKHDWKTLGPLVQGHSVPKIISAAAKRNGKKHGLPGNASWPLLELLAAERGYAQIDELVREYACTLNERLSRT